MINGYMKWLQTALGNNYIVVSEEKTDYDSNKNLVILSEFTGTNYRSCVMFGYQATILTNNVEETMAELQEFTWMHNNELLSTEEFPYLRNIMAQPINVSNFQQYSEKYIGTITISITLIASISLNDIKSITIDGELIDPSQATISYQALTDNNRDNRYELNSTDINEANLQLQVTFPIDQSSLFFKARNIMFGTMPKNTDFQITITFNDNRVFTDKYKMTSNAVSFERSAVTTTTLVFMR